MGARSGLRGLESRTRRLPQPDSRRLLSGSEHHARRATIIISSIRPSPIFPGIPVFHSRDLVNWTQIGNVIDRPSQLRFRRPRHVARRVRAGDRTSRRHLLHPQHLRRLRRQFRRDRDAIRPVRGPIRSGCASSTGSIRRSSSTTTARPISSTTDRRSARRSMTAIARSGFRNSIPRRCASSAPRTMHRQRRRRSLDRSRVWIEGPHLLSATATII